MAFKPLLLLLSLCTTLISCSPTPELPVIDLGYVQQRATVYNSTNDYYVFKNIRFAAPPLGDLRFRKPVPPLYEEEIQDGNITGTECAQTVPGMAVEGEDIYGGETNIIGSEDCLYMDVYVPASLKATDKAPVLHWFFGGGYAIGSKELWGDPAELIKAADEPMIYVASNYRLGAFGWLADANQDIDVNAGLHDVRAAMDWVKNHISKFGGDPERVTVFGESAGAGVIMHTIVAYGGAHSPPPFNQAFLQSPGLLSDRNSFERRSNEYQNFQRAANCTSVECLRAASSETLIASNDVVLKSGLLVPTPVADGDYIPDLAIILLSQGKFHRIDSIVASNTWYESGLFLSTMENITSESFNGFAQSIIANISASGISRLNELYPKGIDQAGEYMRVAELVQDVIINCNVVALAKAFDDDAYRYIFNVSRAWHGDDVYYNFYTPGVEAPRSPPISVWAAKVHQEYLTDYTVKGDPGCADTVPCFTKYGTEENSLVITDEKVEILSADPWNNERCDFLVGGVWEI